MKLTVKRINGEARVPVYVVLGGKDIGRIEKGEFEKEMEVDIQEAAKLSIQQAPLIRTKYRWINNVILSSLKSKSILLKPNEDVEIQVSERSKKYSLIMALVFFSVMIFFAVIVWIERVMELVKDNIWWSFTPLLAIIIMDLIFFRNYYKITKVDDC
jgi:tRNA G37 N-methylase Trm5